MNMVDIDDGDESSKLLHDNMHLSDWRVSAIALVGMISSSLSLYGSITICYLILRQKRWNEIYHRLVLGVSICDILTSFGILIQPFAVPRSTESPLAIGNDVTCQCAAFLLSFSLSASLYSLSLTGFFLMKIKFAKTDRQVRQLLEPWVHMVAPGVALLLGVVTLLVGDIEPHPGLLLCGAAAEGGSPSCASNSRSEADNDCDSSSSSSKSMFASPSVIMVALTCLSALVCVVAMALIWRAMKQRAAATRAHAVDGTLSASHARRVREVGVQALCYSGAYVNLIVWLFLFAALGRLSIGGILGVDKHENLYFAWLLACWFFIPLQGFFNWMIYIRPRLVRWKDANRDRTWLWAYQQVLVQAEAPGRILREEQEESAPPAANTQDKTKTNHSSLQRSDVVVEGGSSVLQRSSEIHSSPTRSNSVPSEQAPIAR